MKVRKADLKEKGDALAKALRQMADHVDSVEDKLPDSMDSTDSALLTKIGGSREDLAAVDAAWQSLLTVAGAGAPAEADVAPEDRIRFDTFLTQIGDAMLRTQRSLDEKSLGYIRESSGKPHVLPSIFRLPKVSAEMKFMLETQDGKEVNLVFLKKQSQAKELHQQMLNFELVSAPAPPAAVTAAQSAVPGMHLVLDPTERGVVLAAATQATTANALPDPFDPTRVVILKAEPEKGYVLLYAADKGANNVGVWLFGDEEFRVIYKYEERTNRSEKFLRQFVADLASAQKAFLSFSR